MFGTAVRGLLQGPVRQARRAVQAARRRREERLRRRGSQDREPARRQEGRRSRPTSRPSTRAQPELAMVNSDKGITNLHVPSDVIIDASMPAAIRASGKMYGRDGKLYDTKALIPDRSLRRPVRRRRSTSTREHGAFDPVTMGTCPNVGLMAQAAEEYGSHDKTFQIAGKGKVRVVDDEGKVDVRARRGSRATSGACARPRTRRSATGSSSRSRAPRPPAGRPCSGSTPSAPHDAQHPRRRCRPT